nr:hypothetical protein [Acidipropionibacterium jensenii]
MHEHPGGGLVDVLSDRDQADVCIAKSGVDDGVVQAVASQAVDLVDDAVLDGVLGDVVEHVLEGAALRGLGGLARFDELLDDDGAELVGLALSCLPLGWD